MRRPEDIRMKVTTTDQMGRTVQVPKDPKRIISLVPSQTELLLDLGLPVVGRTKFCVHPAEKVKSIPVIGGTKQFHLDRIRDLQPDLIIGNKEENYEEGIAALEQEFPVWMSDIVTVQDALDMMYRVGQLGGWEHLARTLLTTIESGLERIKSRHSGRVVYLIWKNPWMAAGNHTFIHSMLTHLGFENAVADSRYPEVTLDQMHSLQPDFVFLSSEPYPFKENHVQELQAQLTHSRVMLVDGEMFNWYGSRLMKAVEYFSRTVFA